MKERLNDFFLLFIIAIAVFYRSVDIQFVGDNLDHIVQAQRNIFDLSFHYFRPLTILTLIFDYAVWGYNHIGYHITNFIFHFMNVILIYVLALKFVEERFFAFTAALMFLLHPIHSSSLFWISGRVDMLCACFYMLAILAFVRYLNVRTTKNLIVTSICFLLAILSKEMAITFPIIAAAYYYFVFSQTGKKTIKQAISATSVFWVIAILFIIFRLFSAGSSSLTGDVHTNVNLIRLAKNAATFMGLLIVPGGQIEIGNLLKSNQTIFAIIAVVAMLIFIFSFRWIRREARLFFFALFILITLLPVVRLAMRWYLYIPSIGFCLALAFLLRKMSIKSDLLRKGALILTAAIALTYTLFVTLEQHRWIKSGEIAGISSEQLAAQIVIDEPYRCLVLNPFGEFEETPVLIHGIEALVKYRLKKLFDYDKFIEIIPANYISIRGSIDDAYPKLEIVSESEFHLSLENSESFFEFPYETKLISRQSQLSTGYSMKMIPFEVTVNSVNGYFQADAITVNVYDPALKIYYMNGKEVVTVGKTKSNSGESL